ncbi:MAG: hypothetical protein RL199_221 [Pseudomonadota bacterium]|jgi:hypothetical protein
MSPSLRSLAALALALPALTACGSDAPVEDSPTGGAVADGKFDGARNARGDWLANTRLPYDGDWLDLPVVLDGLSQFDYLSETTRDEERCGAMVSLAAALLGGPETFEHLLDRIEPKRRKDPRDKAALARARRAFDARTLTAGDLYRTADALLRSYVHKRGGSSDGDIDEMIQASGLEPLDAGSTVPREILADLEPGELFPLNLYLPHWEVWHVTLVFKDDEGTAWVFDSDKRDDWKNHLLREGTPEFGYYLGDETAEWLLQKKYHAPL